MSKSLSVLAYLKSGKKDSKGYVTLYMRVTIDGDVDEFSLSRKILPAEWSQDKQKCVTKSQESVAINNKIAKIRGELIALFDRQPAHQVVKARQLIKLYQGQDPNATAFPKRDSHYHQAVLTMIDQYFAIKTREKKALTAPYRFFVTDNIQQETSELIHAIEELQTISHIWMDDPTVDKTLMDAVFTFLLRFLFRVVKGTASHETFRKWISTKNTIAFFLRRRYKASDLPLTTIPLKLATDFYDYLTLNNSVGNNAAMKYRKAVWQLLLLTHVQMAS